MFIKCIKYIGISELDKNDKYIIKSNILIYSLVTVSRVLSYIFSPDRLHTSYYNYLIKILSNIYRIEVYTSHCTLIDKSSILYIGEV